MYTNLFLDIRIHCTYIEWKKYKQILGTMPRDNHFTIGSLVLFYITWFGGFYWLSSYLMGCWDKGSHCVNKLTSISWLRYLCQRLYHLVIWMKINLFVMGPDMISVCWKEANYIVECCHSNSAITLVMTLN